MKIILTHPTGNANVRAAITGLLNAGMLAKFHTTVATFPGNAFDRMSSFSSFSEFKKRKYDESLRPFTEIWPWYELSRFAAAKIGLKSLNKHETGIFSVDAVYCNLDKHVAKTLSVALKNGTTALYAYEDGAYYSFLEAKRHGIKCLYDLPIGYWRTARRLLEIEMERWPDWRSTLIGFGDSEEKLFRKDEELRMADRIIVASSFTASTLKDFPGKLVPIKVIPYGFPPVCSNRKYSAINGRPLKLLFVGGLSQRKGIADLFAAVKAIGKHVELTVVGRKAVDDCPALNKALDRHTWIPSLPHAEVLKLMQVHDILVFPSLFEGFGLVITEAMSQGTPVITTDRTAGPDLIKHGENGWLFNAGSTEALQAAVEEILSKPGSVADCGRLAMDAARKRPWEIYGQELVEAILKN